MIPKVLVIFSFLFCVSLPGQAGAMQTLMKNVNFNPAVYSGSGMTDKSVDLLAEPIDTVGLLETSAMRTGLYTVYDACMPEELLNKEFFPDRLKWFGWAVNPVGREYLAQIIFRPAGTLKDGRVYFKGLLVVDGTPEMHAGAKVLVFSTRLTKAFAPDYGQKEFKMVDDTEFGSNLLKRLAFVKAHGALIDQFPLAAWAKEELAGWKRFSFPRGFLLSPWELADVRKTAGINPGYTFEQRHIAHGKHAISTSPMATVMGLASDIWRAARADTSGWDEDSPQNQKIIEARKKYLDGLRENIQRRTP